MIRVLGLIPEDRIGGIYRVALDLKQAFEDSSDVSFHLAAVGRRNHSIHTNPAVDQMVVGGWWAQPRSVKKLASSFDIVHLHGFSVLEVAGLVLTRTRVVFTNHGLLGTGRRLSWTEYIKRAFMRIFLRRYVIRVVNVSQYAQDRLVREYKVAREKCGIVYNCTTWKQAKPRLPAAKSLVIGFHGRFVGFKRLDRLIRVAALLRDQRIVQVVLVGSGPMGETVERLAKSLGVNLTVREYTDDVRGFVDGFDIEIVASDEEYFGLAVIEAIQAGVPTFVFGDGGGCTEIFDSRANWFVCADENEMANKILSLDQPDIRREVMNALQHLQERVTTEFSHDKFARRYQQVYQEVAG